MIAGVLAYFRIVAPFNELRAVLRRLAQGDFRPVLLSSHQGLLQETYADVRRISELLQQLDQQSFQKEQQATQLQADRDQQQAALAAQAQGPQGGPAGPAQAPSPWPTSSAPRQN